MASSSPQLLTRDQWRTAVLSRDHGACVLCHGTATEVHHIMERRLFSDGGYYLDNGVSVCDQGCHLRCELSEVSCEELRRVAAISTTILPEGFDHDTCYDKWGNFFDEGIWHPGPLFDDDGVQRVLRRTRRLSQFAAQK